MLIQKNVCASQARFKKGTQQRESLLTHRSTIARSCQVVSESSSFSSYTKQFAFYQAGKCLLQSLFFDHSKISFVDPAESETNALSSFQTLSFIETHSDLEMLLIGLHAGKAGELFPNYPKRRFGEPSFSLQYQNAISTLTLRKESIRVNGVFANLCKSQTLTQATLRARTNSRVMSKLCPAMYTLCDMRSKYPSLNNSRCFVGKKTTIVTTRAKIEGLQRVSGKGVARVQSKLPCSNRYTLKRVEIEDWTQRENLLPLRVTVLDERSNGVLGESSLFALTNRLNRVTIEQFLSQLNIGLRERIKALRLVEPIVVNTSMYAPKLFNLQRNSVSGNLNKTEIKDKKTRFLFQNLEEQTKNLYFQKSMQNSRLVLQKLRFCTENSLLTKQEPTPELFKAHSVQSAESSSKNQSYDRSKAFTTRTPTNSVFFSQRTHSISQKDEIGALCEETVCKLLTSSSKLYGHWFRIYLPQIETHQRQPVSLDQFFKRRPELGFVGSAKKSCSERELSKHTLFACKSEAFARRYKNFVYTKASLIRTTSFLHNMYTQELGDSCHNLVLYTFSRACNCIGKNRELLDLLADHLIRFEKIRVSDLARIRGLYIKR